MELGQVISPPMFNVVVDWVLGEVNNIKRIKSWSLVDVLEDMDYGDTHFV